MPDETIPDRPAGGDEVCRALQEEQRVMLASIPLPDGNIPTDKKEAVIAQTQAFIKQFQKLGKFGLLELEQQTGLSKAILSQLLRGRYGYATDDHIRRLNSWIEDVARRHDALRQEGITTTHIVRAVHTGFGYAKTYSCMVVIVGASGVGKTVAARAGCSQDPKSIYVRLQSTHTNPTAFLRLLAEACRLSQEGGKARLMDAIVERLRGSHRLVVLDEWHQAGRGLYETIRDLHDLTQVPIVLIGTEEIQKRIVETRVRKGAVWSDQFCSRIGLVLDLSRLEGTGGQPRPLFTEEEIRQVFKSDQVRISRDGVLFLQALACSIGLGCLRMAQRCFEMAAKLAKRNGNVIDEKLLRKAFVYQAIPDGLDDSVLLTRIEDSAREIRALAVG